MDIISIEPGLFLTLLLWFVPIIILYRYMIKRFLRLEQKIEDLERQLNK